MEKKVIIVGASSVVAQGYIKWLKGKNKDIEVVTAGRSSEFDIQIDLSSDENIILPYADNVICFASVLRAKSDYMLNDMIKVNILGIMKLLEAIKQAKIEHFVLLSSVSADIEKGSSFYTYYGITKKVSEQLCLKYTKENNIKACILKPSQIIGPGIEYAKNQTMIYSIIQNAIAGKNVVIWGKHNPVRNCVYVNNLFNVLDEVLELEIIGIYRVLGENISWEEIVERVVYLTHSKSRIVYEMKNKEDIEDNVFFCERKEDIYKIYGIPYIDVFTGIEEIVNSLK